MLLYDLDRFTGPILDFPNPDSDSVGIHFIYESKPGFDLFGYQLVDSELNPFSTICTRVLQTRKWAERQTLTNRMYRACIQNYSA